MPTPTNPPDPVAASLHGIPGGPTLTYWWQAAPPPPDRLSVQLARQLLDAHTDPGNVVIDIDDDPVFAATAVQRSRHHHALGGAARLASLGHAAGYIDLILLHWPQPQPNPRWLLVACRALLADTGHLAVAAHLHGADRVPQLTALHGAARTARLSWTRHILAAHGETSAPSGLDSPTVDLLLFTVRTHRHD